MKAYSEDLRQRVLEALDRGMPRADVVRTFRVSLSSLKRYLKQRRDTGSLAFRLPPGRPSTKRAPLIAALPALLAVHSDATLDELCTHWAAISGTHLSQSTMSRAIRAAGWTRKKSRWRPVSATSSSARPSACASQDVLLPTS
jgi:transposase